MYVDEACYVFRGYDQKGRELFASYQDCVLLGALPDLITGLRITHPTCCRIVADLAIMPRRPTA